MNSPGISVVIPALDENGAIGSTLQAVHESLQKTGRLFEIIVVDDGSTDQTANVAEKAGARVLRHPLNEGYGRAILTGLERAAYDTIVITDADATYPVDRLPQMLAFYERGFHMVIGARHGRAYSPTFRKRLLRSAFRLIAEFTCGRTIPDINSGFRIFDRRPVLARRAALSTGFSFTTTITLLFLLEHFHVGYFPIDYRPRLGKSKVRLVRDSLRALQIIVTAIAQFNSLKLFLMLAFVNALGVGFLFSLPIGFPAWRPLGLLGPMLLAWETVTLLAALCILSLVLLRQITMKEPMGPFDHHRSPPSTPSA